MLEKSKKWAVEEARDTLSNKKSTISILVCKQYLKGKLCNYSALL